MKFSTVHFPNGKTIKRMRGGAVGGSLLLKKVLGQSYDSVQEYKGLVKEETRGAWLTEGAMRRLESLRPKAQLDTKRQNIKFSI